MWDRRKEGTRHLEIPRRAIQGSNSSKVPEPWHEKERDPHQCYGYRTWGHFVQDCLGQEAPLETAPSTSKKARPCHYLTTCWAYSNADAPWIPVHVCQQDAAAKLDSGSTITPMRSKLATGPMGPSIAVWCVHGDTRSYPTAHVRILTPRGQCTVRVGVVSNLPREQSVISRSHACAGGTFGVRENI